VKITVPEIRIHLVFADTPRCGVRNRPLQSVAGDDSRLAVINGYKHYNSVITPLLPDSPFLAQACSVVHYLKATKVPHRYNSDLCGGTVLISPELLFQPRFVGFVQDRSEVVYQPGRTHRFRKLLRL